MARHVFTMANYSVDERLRRFSTRRQQLETTAMPSRLVSVALSLEMSHIARLIYGDFVPRVEYRCQLGGNNVAENDEAGAMERKNSKT
ncbi:uncharacterized protein SPSK_10098 [Sporothrix schenckii 1099-18]|uniref:Uncharacterized protein n=1 Tax=Sporothrix schenckii 1099-18 TaxID=1397361 RepID=A0A0F2M7Q6_SPOSC|nr:uncharacterized protein SPSK_10098 [Sporothrix schenckii 1099-18]KJR85723.1 hypothetical protein SPSK_10098 [Sporothrix schenckii 1099-18]